MEKPKRKPVSIKTRFEVFKRDNFTCQYCLAKPPKVPLEIDHIIPVCKGGKNQIDNLLTACFDCNRGKSGNELICIPDSLVVKMERMKLAKQQYQQYQRLLKKQKEIIDNEINQVVFVFEEFFDGYTVTDKFKISIKNFISKLDVNTVVDAMENACNIVKNRHDATKYFCGICWNIIKER